MSRNQHSMQAVDFDIAMGKGTQYYAYTQAYSGEAKNTFQFFKTLYEKNNFHAVHPQSEAKTPRIIHQLWIGARPCPERTREMRRSWQLKHPDWEYVFWTNERVKAYKFASPQLEYLFSQPLTMGERVDILRYDIMYQFGGLYADCDTVCLRSFDELVYRYDFFGSIMYPNQPDTQTPICLQNGLFGCKPYHPILDRVARIIISRWSRIDPEIAADDFLLTIYRTFMPFTQGVIEAADRDGNRDILLPPTYFMPVTPFKFKDFITRGMFAWLMGFVNTRFAPYSVIRDYSFSVCFSDKEWAKDDGGLGGVSGGAKKLLDLLLIAYANIVGKRIPQSYRRETFQDLLDRERSMRQTQ